MEIAAFRLRAGRTNGAVIVVDTDPFDHFGKVGGTLETYKSFLDWLSSAIRETEEWMSEEELTDILDE